MDELNIEDSQEEEYNEDVEIEEQPIRKSAIQQYVDEEEEEQPRRKRRVVMRVLRQAPVYVEPPPTREIRDVAIPMPQAQSYPQTTIVYQNGQPQQQQSQRKPSVKMIREEIKQRVQYEQMLQQEMMRAQYMNRPKPTTSEKFLNIANRAAFGDDGRATQRVNAQLGKDIFRRPKVDIVAKVNPNRNGALTKINNTLQGIAPKLKGSVKAEVPFKKKKGSIW